MEAVPKMSTAEDVVATARDSFNRGVTKSLEFRLKQLEALLRLIEENFKNIEDAIMKDFRKPKFEVTLYETEFLKNEIKHTIKNLKGWMKPTKVDKSLPFIMDEAFIYPEPYGVVLVIGPWNYPLLISLSPMVGALAAGNCVVVKPSEITSNFAQIIAKLFPKYLDSNCYHVVTGGIPETTVLLEQKFDYIFYTGCSSVGKIIQKAASKFLTPLTLELGGKTPVYVDDRVDVNLAVSRILWGKCINAGQSCVAPDFILCSKEMEKKFIQAAKSQIKTWFGDDVKESPDFGRIVNDNHYRRIVKLMQGSQIALGGKSDPQERFIEPTILQGVNSADIIMQEEIFGPVLPIVNIRNAEEAVSFINKMEKPLALYVFSNDSQIHELFLKNTSSGNLLVNDTMMHFSCDTLPFGGVGNSGMGAYHGKFSFDTFSHSKGTLIKKLSNFGERMSAVRYPPYNLNNLNYMSKMSTKSFPRLPCLTHILTFFVGMLITWFYMVHLQN